MTKWPKMFDIEYQPVVSGGAVGSDNAKSEWEYFCDAAYYDMWAVREKGETRWGHCFHVPTLEEAKSLADILSNRTALKLRPELLEKCTKAALLAAGFVE
jgi:hypothetical protein